MALMHRILRLASLVALLGGASAVITLPSVFSDGVVLQRDAPVKVWGLGRPREDITVAFNGESASTVTSGRNWEVELPSMDANPIPQVMTITGSKSGQVTVSNVRVGEVWFGSGQSNMEWSLSRYLQSEIDATIADLQSNIAGYDLHLFDVTKNGGNIAATTWEVISETNVRAFSAMLYYFGRELAKDDSLAGVPIGLMTSAVGGTQIERWATCAGQGDLYTGRIVGMQPFRVGAVMWYQGEADSSTGAQPQDYEWQLACLINEWRTDWGFDFPFYAVQLPKLLLSYDQPHVVRDAVLQNYFQDPLLHMIVTTDLPTTDLPPGAGDWLHPPKEPFATRMANLALAEEYSQAIQALSPIYDEGKSSVLGSELHIVFSNVYDGLSTPNGTPLAEWEISPDGNSWYSVESLAIATSNTVDDTVVVSSSQVSCPTSARYASRPNPVDHDLYNSAGLPASPIREVIPSLGSCDGSTPSPTSSPSKQPSNSPTPPPSCDDDGICELGEDCNNCPSDCMGRSTGKPSERYCCGDGVAVVDVEGTSGETLCDGNP